MHHLAASVLFQHSACHWLMANTLNMTFQYHGWENFLLWSLLCPDIPLAYAASENASWPGSTYTMWAHVRNNIKPYGKSKSKSKSQKTFFNVGQCKQYNISSHLKWVLIADQFIYGTCNWSPLCQPMPQAIISPMTPLKVALFPWYFTGTNQCWPNVNWTMIELFQ